MIPKNIYIYWNQEEIPTDIIKNVKKWKTINPNFTVKLINSDYIENILKEQFPKLLELFKKITISACKADIARAVVLYNEGGIYVDSCTIPLKSIELFYESNKNSDFILSYNYNNNDFSTQVLFGRKKSEILEKIIKLMEHDLENLYKQECETKLHVEYNILILTGIFPYMRILNYDLGQPRDINKKEYIDNLKKYNISFFSTTDESIRHYGCNINHHHNKNFHLHWSNLQKRQKLFFD
jgi:mannosyltransferase OCH1-like enzyme